MHVGCHNFAPRDGVNKKPSTPSFPNTHVDSQYNFPWRSVKAQVIVHTLIPSHVPTTVTSLGVRDLAYTYGLSLDGMVLREVPGEVQMNPFAGAPIWSGVGESQYTLHLLPTNKGLQPVPKNVLKCIAGPARLALDTASLGLEVGATSSAILFIVKET